LDLEQLDSVSGDLIDGDLFGDRVVIIGCTLPR